MRMQRLAALLACAAIEVAHAADVVNAGPNDARIRIVTYMPNDVTVVRVQQGVVTRIMLEPTEKIEIASVGMSSDCKRDVDEWCISANPGSNQIFVRPRDNARENNMELHTNKRDYSFKFEVIDARDSRGKRGPPEPPIFRVVFDFPKPPAAVESATERAAMAEALLRRADIIASRPAPRQADPDFGLTPAQRLKSEGVQLRNMNYTKQVLPNGEDAEPTLVFDDGRFTYFEFPGAREIPAVFAHGSDDEATRVNWHMSGNFVVVQRTARRFTLRLGDAVVGVFNEEFDATGVETPTATVSPAVVREIKEGGR